MNSRRQFLQSSIVAGFPAIVPASVFGAAAPSNRIQVAQIGCGRIARGSEIPGILRNSDVARFVADAEAIYSYEGTKEINTLIVGRAITGYSAFV